MKILLFSVIFFITSLFGYVTATSADMSNPNRLVYQNGYYIDTYNNTVNFPGMDKKFFVFQPVKQRVFINENCQDGVDSDGNFCTREVNISVVPYKELLNYFNNDNLNSVIYIKKNDKYILATIKKERADFNSTVFGEKELNYLSVTDNNDNPVFGIYYDTQGMVPYLISINGKNYRLKQIVNNDVKNYLKLKNSLKTKLTKFDFTDEPVWAKYKIVTKKGIRYLNTKFKMLNKKNGLFEVLLSGSTYAFKPDEMERDFKRSTYLFNLDDSVFEYQTVLSIDGQNVLTWRQDPRKIRVPMLYLDENGNQREKVFIRNNKPMYDINGVWYLISWLSQKQIPNYDISFITTTRFEGKITEISPYEYEVKIFTGDIVVKDWLFVLDKYHKIIKVDDKKNGIKLLLSGEFLNNTILKNRKKLKDFIKSHNLKVINEN